MSLFLFEAEFKGHAVMHLEESLPRIEKCLSLLTEDQVWQRPNPESNSVANLILHLCGNITQYIISNLGNQPDARKRDAEFGQMGGLSKSALMGSLEDVISEAVVTVKGLTRDELVAKRYVQGFHYSGIGSVMHVVEHLSYHVGQIAFYTKLLRSEDLRFYGDMDLDVVNGK